ncbi:septum formation initiator family protein [Crocinitomix algicola]|uniref:septum formation initiator family protein n=1 Tax=Crocinitomix algicola TaxID=1740263 RepID=UPI000871EE72|nr:septum formation initiator family protein [Crocinitomix algicola]
MKDFAKKIRNKYILSSLFVVVYILILHDTDIVTLINRQNRVESLENEIERKKTGIIELKESIEQLEDLRKLEKYAREEHLFKKDDEDLFILSFE